MRWLRTPVVLFGFLAILFLAGVGASAQLLPERAATHFNLAGSLLVITMFGLSRFVPNWMINLPHKEFWLSPVMRPHTNRWLIEHGFWLACLMTGLFGGLHTLTVMANRNTPVRLPTEHSTSQLAAFLVLLALWIFRLLRHFRDPDMVSQRAFARG